jgi:hypothetical protein
LPVRLIFRCQFCDRTPDAETQASLECHLQQPRFGEYLDGAPERWLVWQGRGIYGPERVSCPHHRGELTAFLREHYGTVGWHPWAMGPYPHPVRSEGIARMRGRTSATPGFGLPGG